MYRTYARLTPGAYIYQSLMDMREFMTACKDAKLLDKDFDERYIPGSIHYSDGRETGFEGRETGDRGLLWDGYLNVP